MRLLGADMLTPAYPPEFPDRPGHERCRRPKLCKFHLRSDLDPCGVIDPSTVFRWTTAGLGACRFDQLGAAAIEFVKISARRGRPANAMTPSAKSRVVRRFAFPPWGQDNLNDASAT